MVTKVDFLRIALPLANFFSELDGGSLGNLDAANAYFRNQSQIVSDRISHSLVTSALTLAGLTTLVTFCGVHKLVDDWHDVVLKNLELRRRHHDSPGRIDDVLKQ